MVNVDISNVWTCVSCPELLGSEQDVFDAHNRLRDNQPEGPNFMSWLHIPTVAAERLIEGIGQAARTICDQSEILLVCGSGGAYHGTKAAIEAYCGADRNLRRRPRILHIGQSLSTRQWMDLSRLLQDRDYSLYILSPDGQALAANVAVRGLRWMMERKYGADAKNRIYVATMVGTPLHTMAQEEGYTVFPLPKKLGGAASVLTSAAFVPMAVAGIDPSAVLEGAKESDKELDIRSFENPAWLYAAARKVLLNKGRNRELFCLTDHNLQALGQWWQRKVRRQNSGLTTETVLLPGDLEDTDHLANLPQSRIFETIVRFEADTRKVPVEMDWKDYDGLGALSGKCMADVEQSVLQAMIQVHNAAGVPILDVEAGELSAENLGALLHFLELSAALTSMMIDETPFAAEESAVYSAALESLGTNS